MGDGHRAYFEAESTTFANLYALAAAEHEAKVLDKDHIEPGRPTTRPRGSKKSGATPQPSQSSQPAENEFVDPEAGGSDEEDPDAAEDEEDPDAAEDEEAEEEDEEEKKPSAQAGKGKGKGKGKAKAKEAENPDGEYKSAQTRKANKAKKKSALAELIDRPLSASESETVWEMGQVIAKSSQDMRNKSREITIHIRSKYADAPQGREFSIAARTALPLLRMVYMHAGVFKHKASAAESRTAGAAAAAACLYGDVVYDTVVRPLLANDVGAKLRDAFVKFFRVSSFSKKLPSDGPSPPPGVSRSEPLRFWLPWDWATLEEDLKRVGRVLNSIKGSGAGGLEGASNRAQLIRRLQRELTKIGNSVVHSVVIMHALKVMEAEEAQSGETKFVSDSQDAFSGVRDPYERLMEVRCDRRFASSGPGRSNGRRDVG